MSLACLLLHWQPLKRYFATVCWVPTWSDPYSSARLTCVKILVYRRTTRSNPPYCQPNSFASLCERFSHALSREWVSYSSSDLSIYHRFSPSCLQRHSSNLRPLASTLHAYGGEASYEGWTRKITDAEFLTYEVVSLSHRPLLFICSAFHRITLLELSAFFPWIYNLILHICHAVTSSS